MRPKTRVVVPEAGATAARYAVFTALAGTLLDPDTLEAGPNDAMVQRLHAAGVPIVPMTVMTLEEVTPLAMKLGFRQAMVIEAGAAIARWVDGGWEVEPCGPPAETLLDVVREIEDRSGADLSVYSVLPDGDAIALSGREGDMLLRSRRRCYSEPFVIERGDAREVSAAAAALGFSVRRGRRFLHLCRKCDEGEAYARLREELRCEIAIAVGGSPVDAEFLRRAEIPIVMPSRDGEVDAELLDAVTNARIAPAPAPEGWAAAIDAVWPAAATGRRRVRR